MKSKIQKKNFGSFIRELRLDLGIGQRELAKKIGIAASYLNDIEKEKRAPPKLNIIKKISTSLNTDINQLNDLAGISKKAVAPDIQEYLTSNPKVISLIRSIKENNLTDGQIDQIEVSINKNTTKALIIAAGLGSRLKKHTENLPKCMLDFGGKTLLERQLEVYKKCKITDVSLIRGYKKEKINYKGIKYFENTDFRNNNILNSIFYAEDIEHIKKGPIDALKSSGATKSQIISFGVIPQILPSFVANNLYILDRNIRMATMLGIVGAGGIGYELQSSFRMFEYQKVSSIIILIFITIFIIDHISSFIRSKIK